MQTDYENKITFLSIRSKIFNNGTHRYVKHAERHLKPNHFEICCYVLTHLSVVSAPTPELYTT